MNEGTNAVLLISDETYKVSYYKIKERVDDDYFSGSLDLTLEGNDYPEVEDDEPCVARLIVNGDAVWYFPWVWFEEATLPKMKASVNGAIFCPFGLTIEDEERYDAINLIIVSDADKAMTEEVWKNLLFVFADWLNAKSIPQYQEFVDLANEVEIPDEDEYNEEDSSESASADNEEEEN